MSFFAEYWAEEDSRAGAFASMGLARWTDRLRNATSNRGIEGVREWLLAYATAAHEDPDTYRAMFVSPPAIDGSPGEHEFLRADNPVFAQLSERVSECVEHGVLRGDVSVLTTLLWTATHGAAMATTTYTKYPFHTWISYVTNVVDTTVAGIQATH